MLLLGTRRGLGPSFPATAKERPPSSPPRPAPEVTTGKPAGTTSTTPVARVGGWGEVALGQPLAENRLAGLTGVPAVKERVPKGQKAGAKNPPSPPHPRSALGGGPL